MEYSFLALYFDNNWPKITKQQKNSTYKPNTSASAGRELPLLSCPFHEGCEDCNFPH